MKNAQSVDMAVRSPCGGGFLPINAPVSSSNANVLRRAGRGRRRPLVGFSSRMPPRAKHIGYAIGVFDIYAKADRPPSIRRFRVNVRNDSLFKVLQPVIHPVVSDVISCPVRQPISWERWKT